MSNLKGDVLKLEKGDRVAIALSGGSDSMALLDMLIKEQIKYNFSIIAVYVNHGLRKQSDLEEFFLRNYCLELGVPFFSTQLDLSATTSGIEEEARKKRYCFIKEVAAREQCNIIMTAHHMNDQAETVFLNLVRGSGATGLSGISFETKQEEFTLIRPLLDYSKQDILNYCTINNIPYFNDHSNFETHYSRNFIRNKIFPELEERFGRVQKKFVQASRLISQERHLIENIVQYYALQWINIRGRTVYLIPELFIGYEELLEKSGFGYLDQESRDYLLNELVREALAQLGRLKDISETNINQIVAFFNSSKAGNIDLPHNLTAGVASGNYYILDKRDLKEKLGKYSVGNLRNKNCDFYFGKEQLALRVRSGKLKDFNLPQKNESRILLKQSLLSDNTIFRSRESGDRLEIEGMKNPKKLNRFFIDEKIPAYLRDNFPVIESDNKIIWIPTLYFNHLYEVTNPEEEVIELAILNFD